MDKQTLKIAGEYIKLQDLLKLSGLCQTGGHAKIVINNGEVKVDNEICTMRGKKLRTGDAVEFDDNIIEIIMV